MSSTSPSVTATVTALLALTTPFVAPPGCPHFTTTSLSFDSSINSAAVVLVVDDVPSCYPDSWANVVPESRLNFKPGVCPDNWVYHSIGQGEDSDEFRAYCCDSGFDYLYFNHSEVVTKNIVNACGRWTSRLDSASGSDASTTTSDNTAGSTLLVHRAWAITWYSSDIPSLTPQPPAITNNMLVPTWTPGEVIPDGKYDREGSRDNLKFLPQPLYLFIAIGIPLISASLVGSCVFCCVRNCRKKKKAQRAMAAVEGRPGEK